MRMTNDDYKPSLLDEDELAHYGVKGMKWGVRRDQRALDRAAGRTPPKGRGRGAAIRDARRASTETYVKRSEAAVKRNRKAQVVRDVVEKEGGSKRTSPPTSKAYEKAMADFNKADAAYKQARVDHRDNPERAAAARVTYGEAAALMVLTTPAVAIPTIVGTTAYGRGVARNQRERVNSGKKAVGSVLSDSAKQQVDFYRRSK